MVGLTKKLKKYLGRGQARRPAVEVGGGGCRGGVRRRRGGERWQRGGAVWGRAEVRGERGEKDGGERRRRGEKD
jgi:hypothetical protein